jgi:hypothetical protein
LPCEFAGLFVVKKFCEKIFEKPLDPPVTGYYMLLTETYYA